MRPEQRASVRPGTDVLPDSRSAPESHERAIPRTWRVAVGGLPYFGRKAAALLSGEGWWARYLETRGWRPDAALATLATARQADVLYQLGGQIERGSRPHALLTLVRRPCVMQWTGSDVLYARSAIERGRVTERLRRGCTHLAGAPWLVEELAALGITAHWTPHSAIDAPATVVPLPDSITVLAYLRAGRERFYGLEAVRQVATALPEVRVVVVGTDRLPGRVPPNVSVAGWVRDMAGVYAGATVLLRMTEHDGLAFMVQEALAHGRYAVWNHPFPGATLALDADQAVAGVRELYERWSTGHLMINEAGAAHVRERYNPRRIRDDLRHELLRAVRTRRG